MCIINKNTEYSSISISKNNSRLLFLFAITRFFSSQFILYWETYYGGVFYAPSRLLELICSFIPMIIAIFGKQGERYILNLKELLVLLVLLLFEIESIIVDYSSFGVGAIRLLFLVLSLLLIDEDYKAKAFEYMIKCFALMILPAAIYYLFDLVGISFPHNVLMASGFKSQNGFYYDHYPLGLVLTRYGAFKRYTGLFDEPGMIGTLSIIFYAASKNRIKKRWTFLILAEGVLTLSLAFYVLLAIFELIEAIYLQKKRLIIVIVSLLVVLFILENVQFSNPFLARIQGRFDFTSSTLIIDNRASDEFEMIYDNFMQKGGLQVLFGAGHNTGIDVVNSGVDVSSYKMLIYSYGIVGFVLYILVFVLYANCYKILRTNIPFLSVFLLSIYQRPNVLNAQYFSVFACALAFISVLEIKRNRNSLD